MKRSFSTCVLTIGLICVTTLISADEVRWGKPGNSGKKSVSKVAVASYSEPVKQESSPILQVQNTVVPPKVAPSPMSDAQRDTHYRERRPQEKTVPSGAVHDTSRVAPTLAPIVDTPHDILFRELQPQGSETSNPSDMALISRLPMPDEQNTYAPAGDCEQISGFRSIKEIAVDIKPIPGELPGECPLITTGFNGRNFARTNYCWTASALCTKAAYFEDPKLSRY